MVVWESMVAEQRQWDGQRSPPRQWEKMQHPFQGIPLIEMIGSITAAPIQSISAISSTACCATAVRLTSHATQLPPCGLSTSAPRNKLSGLSKPRDLADHKVCNSDRH